MDIEQLRYLYLHTLEPRFKSQQTILNEFLTCNQINTIPDNACQANLIIFFSSS